MQRVNRSNTLRRINNINYKVMKLVAGQDLLHLQSSTGSGMSECFQSPDQGPNRGPGFGRGSVAHRLTHWKLGSWLTSRQTGIQFVIKELLQLLLISGGNFSTFRSSVVTTSAFRHKQNHALSNQRPESWFGPGSVHKPVQRCFGS